MRQLSLKELLNPLIPQAMIPQELLNNRTTYKKKGGFQLLPTISRQAAEREVKGSRQEKTVNAKSWLTELIWTHSCRVRENPILKLIDSHIISNKIMLILPNLTQWINSQTFCYRSNILSPLIIKILVLTTMRKMILRIVEKFK